MAQKVTMNEQELREYVENGVREALLKEGVDEGVFDILRGGNAGQGLNNNGMLARVIKEHFNFPDLINLAIGIFGVAPLVRWLCEKFGIDVDGPFGKMLTTALSGLGTVAIGDAIQNRRQNKE